jgi:hypothetical protein
MEYFNQIKVPLMLPEGFFYKHLIKFAYVLEMEYQKYLVNVFDKEPAFNINASRLEKP